MKNLSVLIQYAHVCCILQKLRTSADGGVCMVVESVLEEIFPCAFAVAVEGVMKRFVFGSQALQLLGCEQMPIHD